MESVLGSRFGLARKRQRAQSRSAEAGIRGLVRTRRSWRVGLLTLIGVCAVASGTFMWFRSSSFVAVSEVSISGVRGPQAGAIEASLRAAAKRQSTLAPSLGALRSALARFPQVRSLSISTSFPHAMRITVSEQLPVAILQAPDGRRSAVAADGRLLGRALAGTTLAVLHVDALSDPSAHAQPLDSYLALLGGAPEALLPFIETVQSGAKGLTVTLRDGLSVYFGSPGQARAKWLSLARVLLATNIAQLRYVDVREPQRPAVGLVAGAQVASASPPGENGALGTGAGAGAAAEQSALIATLQRDLGSGPSASPESASPAGGTPTGEASSAEAAGGESAAGGGVAAGGESAAGAGAAAGGESTASQGAPTPEGESAASAPGG
jgi:cell division protein FtsQ